MNNNQKRIKLDEILQPILSNDLISDIPLINVYITTIKDKKQTSNIIKELNKLLPIPELTHLKRINKTMIILEKCDNININDLKIILKNNNINSNLIDDNYQIVHVAKILPITHKQYQIVNKLWPCNYHPNKYIEKLVTNTLFTQHDIYNHINFMSVAIEIAKINQSKYGCVVVNSKTNSILTVGFKKFKPYEHSLMVAIDNISKIQRHMSPYPFLIKKLKDKYSDLLFNDDDDGDDEIGEERNDEHLSYLLTGYYVYSTHEPCIGCAMALIHSRVKRLFFGRKSNNGALTTLCKIHTLKNLNHHYEVFGGLLEKECSQL